MNLYVCLYVVIYIFQLHFIFRHKNPLNGSFEEKHSKPPKSKIDEYFSDAKPHLFKLIIKPDNTFSIYIDNKVTSFMILFINI